MTKTVDNLKTGEKGVIKSYKATGTLAKHLKDGGRVRIRAGFFQI